MDGRRAGLEERGVEGERGRLDERGGMAGGWRTGEEVDDDNEVVLVVGLV